MGILKPFSRAPKPLRPERLPSGCFTLNAKGGLAGSTLPSSFPNATLMQIGRVVMDTFASAHHLNLPLADLHIHFSGLTITAREMRGGALVFLTPATLHLAKKLTAPAMHYKSLEEFILHLENYIECWKQFNHYVNLARDKKFSREDETHFLEIKSILAQGLEAIASSAEKGVPRKEEMSAIFSNAPSLRSLSEMPEAGQNVEAQWHKIFLTLQSLLGQLKVQQGKTEKGPAWSLFGAKK